MKKRSIAIGIGFLFSLITTNLIAQGQVYLYGQLASNVASTKLTDIVQVRTHQPLVQFDLTQPYAAIAKTTLFNRNASISISSIASKENSRVAKASITSGEMPSGTVLRLNVETPSQNNSGNPGNAGSEVALGNASKTILSNIRTCFTGKSPKDGYVLEYSCEIPAKNAAYNALKGKSVTVTITVGSDS